jgi:hypothetical protein
MIAIKKTKQKKTNKVTNKNTDDVTAQRLNGHTTTKSRQTEQKHQVVRFIIASIEDEQNTSIAKKDLEAQTKHPLT